MEHPDLMKELSFLFGAGSMASPYTQLSEPSASYFTVIPMDLGIHEDEVDNHSPQRAQRGSRKVRRTSGR